MEKRFESIEGLRAISCLSIIAMHVLYNTDYRINGFLYETFIPSLTWLVYLFLMISGFGICNGYLERFLNNSASLELFYKRRFQKILPFFGFLIVTAIALEPSVTNFYEASIELTMLHGLLPNNTLNLLGVCWTLGVIFLFYMLFPAFSVLMRTKKRAWAAFGISLWINFICQNYFFGDPFVTESFSPRHSFIYCIPLFIGGGIVYLYRGEIRRLCKRFGLLALAICIAATALYYVLPHKIGVGDINIEFYFLLVIFMLWLSYAVGVDSKVLSCKAMKYLSGISMEMYLAQMIIFRLVEKCNLLYILGTGWVGYLMTFGLTVIGLIIFVECYNWIVRIVVKHWPKRA